MGFGYEVLGLVSFETCWTNKWRNQDEIGCDRITDPVAANFPYSPSAVSSIDEPIRTFAYRCFDSDKKKEFPEDGGGGHR